MSTGDYSDAPPSPAKDPAQALREWIERLFPNVLGEMCPAATERINRKLRAEGLALLDAVARERCAMREDIRRVLEEERLGDEFARREGLSVTTGLRAAIEALRKHLPDQGK